jgi:hypothetical protein
MAIFDQVLYFIRKPEPARFESLAMAVFRYQAEHVPMYRAYLEDIGVDANRIHSSKQIPPVSTSAFKYARIENRLHPESRESTVFLTSGTTIGRDERGRHIVPEPEVYRASAIQHLKRMMFPDGQSLAMLALHPTTDRMPESSLSQMISWCIDEFGNGQALCAATRQSLDTNAALQYLRSLAWADTPVCILGTTAACALLFEAALQNHAPITLPLGSRLMDTGGAKGQRIPLTPDQFVKRAQSLLGVKPQLVINEYGMTEMCSQLYDATSFNSDSSAKAGARMKLAPPWLKPAALDPLTLNPMDDGQPGMLAFFDLANVGSISALLTEDLGLVRDHQVVILGRATIAGARGCALAIQQFATNETAP